MQNFSIRIVRAVVVATAVVCVGMGQAMAADLRIGFKAEVTSADPHVLNGSNRNVWMHVYEGLLLQDNKLAPKPGLAVSWRAVDDTTWEFKLRPNVNFHNGAVMNAEDVKFSIERAMGLSGPRTFRSYLKSIDSVQQVDASTVRVKTKGPDPTLPDNIGLIAIVPKSIGKDANEASFEGGKSAIGTGPYRFAEWQHGQHIALSSFDKYWAEREPWGKVTFQFIPKEPARASALLAGSVDVIDGSSAGLAETFQRTGKVDLVSTTSYMLNYLYFDVFRSNSPFVTGNDGQPLAKNPLSDVRVRQAISLAINRDGINKFVMKGDAEPAGQFVPSGFFGHNAAIKAPVADPKRAKALLAEAGYPNGFKLSLHCSNDRYLNDARVCEAIGQMLTQVGIGTDVRTLPFAVFQTRSLTGGEGGEPEFSMGMLGIGAVTGDSLSPMISTVATFDKKKGAGANNRGRFSSKTLDEAIAKAGLSMDQKERDAVQQSAAKMNADEIGILPIHHLKASWAIRKGLTLTPRADGFTTAMSIREGGK